MTTLPDTGVVVSWVPRPTPALRRSARPLRALSRSKYDHVLGKQLKKSKYERLYDTIIYLTFDLVPTICALKMPLVILPCFTNVVFGIPLSSSK
ncbi:hypothetical protein EYC84_003513 [Monilinia fructicola]|uniref:Uncharacterized protein n=1 Tax=Monilinia fructicola TaxID=38448 RepID=A0A5M9JYJ7_MONFR|nr:hypothetical protein EYC84_003513 [Monilinia fructicola]